MYKIYTVFYIASSAFRRFVRSSKIIVLLILMIVIRNIIIEPLRNVADDTGYAISMLEPFVSLTNSGIILFAIPICFMVLMADFPERESFDIMLGMRTTKRVWTLGQIVFSFYAAVSYILFLLLATMIMVIDRAYFTTDFSYGITHYTVFFPEREHGVIADLIPQNLFNQMNLMTALGRTFILLLLYILGLMNVLLFFTLIGKRSVGLIIDFLLVVGGVVTTAAQSKFQWCFPMAHTIPWHHFRQFYSKPLFPMWGSYLYLGVFTGVFFVLCIVFSRKYE